MDDVFGKLDIEGFRTNASGEGLECLWNGVWTSIPQPAANLINHLRAGANGWQVTGPPWEFDRYINGTLMAEGVKVERETNFADALRVAAKLAAKGPNREVPVLVCRAAPPAAMAPRGEGEPMSEADAISEAAMAMRDRGIDIALPWNCDLDDLERERYEALVAACHAYVEALQPAARRAHRGE